MILEGKAVPIVKDVDTEKPVEMSTTKNGDAVYVVIKTPLRMPEETKSLAFGYGGFFDVRGIAISVENTKQLIECLRALVEEVH